MRRFAGDSARDLITSAVLFAVLFVGVPAIAHATPTTPAIAAKRAQAAAAQRKLDDLDAQMELKVEDYNAAAAALEKTRADITRTEADLQDAQRHFDEAQALLDLRVESMYRGGRIDLVGVLMGTSSFGDFLVRLDVLNRISTSDASLVRQVSAARDRVESEQVALQHRESEQVALRQQAEAARVQVEAALRSQQAYLGGLNTEITKLVREEQARQRVVAAELARKAARDAAARASSSTWSRSGSGGTHADTVQIALRYLGVPYVWGGSSPSGFDCSGLTQYVYAQIGVSLPRTSRDQFHAGTSIAKDRTDLLQPGDLVFFGYGGDPDRIHHVGLYVGDGDFIHAPASGDHVRVSSLRDRIASRGDYVGGVRR